MRIVIVLLVASAAMFAQQPQRIVSTSPSITETLFALGLGERVVGVSAYCHFPAKVEGLPKVGTYLKPNVEVIARLKPDLVIVQKLPNSVRDQLQSLSIRVAEIESGDLRQNLDSMLEIGKAAGVGPAARTLVDRLRQQLGGISNGRSGKTPRSIAFIVGRTPGKLEAIVAVGGGSYLSELMTIAGGRNVFADSGQLYVKTSLESLLRRNPDVLIDMADMSAIVGISENAKRQAVELWGTRSALNSVREHRVYPVASDIFVVPGPRMIDAALAFSEMLRSEQQK